MTVPQHTVIFFFFNDTATTEIYTLSLHDALPISAGAPRARTQLGHGAPLLKRRTAPGPAIPHQKQPRIAGVGPPRSESTRLNSSHANISYAVFCLKKNNRDARHRKCSLLKYSHVT